MGLFGLSNKAVSFLGGVASGVEEVIDKDEAYTNELVKDSASMIIKARLDSKERRRQRVSEYGRIRRNPCDSSVSPVAGRGRTRCLSDSSLGPRHECLERRDRGLPVRRRQL